MTTDEASEPRQEPSDNDQGGTAGGEQAEANVVSEPDTATAVDPDADASPEPDASPDADADADSEAEAEADAEAGATAEPEGPGEPNQERLDGLQEDIDRVRARVDDEPGGADVGVPETETDRQFVEPGEQEPVDDTIAPPG